MERLDRREYLEGFAFQTRVIMRCFPVPVFDVARGAIVLAIMRAGRGGEDDPFTPYGAGMADAALSAWGF